MAVKSHWGCFSCGLDETSDLTTSSPVHRKTLKRTTPTAPLRISRPTTVLEAEVRTQREEQSVTDMVVTLTEEMSSLRRSVKGLEDQMRSLESTVWQRTRPSLNPSSSTTPPRGRPPQPTARKHTIRPSPNFSQRSPTRTISNSSVERVRHQNSSGAAAPIMLARLPASLPPHEPLHRPPPPSAARGQALYLQSKRKQDPRRNELVDSAQISTQPVKLFYPNTGRPRTPRHP